MVSKALRQESTERGSNVYPHRPATDAGSISLSPSAIARPLGAVAFLLVLASIAGQVSTYVFGHGSLKGFVDLFNLDREMNVPTYFSLLLLLAVFLLLSFIAVLHRRQRTASASMWAFLGIGFLYLGYDEIFAVHENLYVPVRALLGNRIPWFVHYAWVIPGTAGVVGLGLFFRNFLLQLSGPTRRGFLTAAALYVGGALGSDALISGPYAAVYGEQNLTYAIMTAAEEGLEMAGLIVFISALIGYCATTFADVRVRFEATEDERQSVAIRMVPSLSRNSLSAVDKVR